MWCCHRTRGDGESGTGLCHPHLNTGLLEHDLSRQGFRTASDAEDQSDDADDAAATAAEERDDDPHDPKDQWINVLVPISILIEDDDRLVRLDPVLHAFVACGTLLSITTHIADDHEGPVREGVLERLGLMLPVTERIVSDG